MKNYSAILLSIINLAVKGLSDLDPDDVKWKENADQWSKQEILGHLIDSAYNNHRRFTTAVLKEDLIFDGYVQDQWVRINQYQSREWTELINIWYQVNLHLSRLIDVIPMEVLKKKTVEHNFHKIAMNRIEKDSQSSLSYLIWDYIFHLEHHLGQLLINYEKKLVEYSERT